MKNICLLPTAFCLLPSAFCFPPSAFCFLPFAFCFLPFAFCLLLSAFRRLPTAFGERRLVATFSPHAWGWSADLGRRIGARDVRVAWSRSTTAFQNLDVTAQLLRQATLALDLAQGRYNLGLSSIVELSQAQLNLTQAEIENSSAKYEYQGVYATLQYTFGLLR